MARLTLSSSLNMAAATMGTAFTYNGYPTESGGPAGGHYALRFEADDVHEALLINVVGSHRTPLRWVASVRTAEVLFP
jgi:hypothetical protein